MARENVNRRYDLAAFAAIVDNVDKNGSITLDMGNEKGCNALRLMFYKWRRSEQDLNADPSFLNGYVVRVNGNLITFTGGLANPDLRAALASAGIEVVDPEAEELDEEI